MTSKAGRHRIYSSEERKDRNRTAQAAFRDRRNKYTQNVETALHLFEDKVKTLEASEKQLTERAQSAEHRCSQLESKVADLQRMIEAMMVKPTSPSKNIAPPPLIS
jgi:phage shock protein A